MAVDADCLSPDGVLQQDASESELVGMDDRLDEEGNWLLMFPVSSLIWEETVSWIIFPFSQLLIQLFSMKLNRVIYPGAVRSVLHAVCPQTIPRIQ